MSTVWWMYFSSPYQGIEGLQWWAHQKTTATHQQECPGLYAGVCRNRCAG
jgi:hypothetical protein